jgi:hypothetical protein
MEEKEYGSRPDPSIKKGFHSSGPDPRNVEKGPCRETAVERLRAVIAEKRAELIGYEQLLKIAEQAEPGSPLDEVLWKLAWRQL